MKKLALLICIFSLTFACKNAPEKAPDEVAIETTEDGKVLLRLKPKKGDKSDMKMTMKMNGQGDVPVEMDMDMDISLNVLDIIDTVYTYSMDIKRIKMNTSTQGVSINYDSSGDNQGMAAMMGEAFEPMLANTVTMKMTDMAKIIDMDWGDAMQAAGQQNIDFQGLSVPLPQEAVGVGDSWTAFQDTQDGKSMELTMTVEKITSSEVFLGVKGNLEEAPNSNITGSYVLDRATSFTKNGEMKMNLEQGGQKFDMTVNFKQM